MGKIINSLITNKAYVTGCRLLGARFFIIFSFLMGYCIIVTWFAMSLPVHKSENLYKPSETGKQFREVQTWHLKAFCLALHRHLFCLFKSLFCCSNRVCTCDKDWLFQFLCVIRERELMQSSLLLIIQWLSLEPYQTGVKGEKCLITINKSKLIHK